MRKIFLLPLLVVLYSCNDNTKIIKEESKMKTEENKAIVRKFIEEVVNKHNLEVVDELFAPTYVLHLAGNPEPMKGAESVKQAAQMYSSAFPDWHNTLDMVIAEGNIVVTQWTERGTHQGVFQGIAPTGKQVTFIGMDIFRIDNGKIVEQWVYADMLGFMQQIGAVQMTK